ncbi:MAG: hypothetical protein IAF02_00505 [Anaerolineae bacterium]|nr:hypothetical protein [Anaerolineae bacterium]
MSFPAKFPGLKWITAVYALYGFFWISLEGTLVGVTVMGVSTTAVVFAYLVPHLLGDRLFSAKGWLGITAVLGIIFGLNSGILTLFFMVVKTGLHAHGPEFTPPEVAWILQQTLWWTVVGLLAGLGLGMVTSKRMKDEG